MSWGQPLVQPDLNDLSIFLPYIWTFDLMLYIN